SVSVVSCRNSFYCCGHSGPSSIRSARVIALRTAPSEADAWRLAPAVPALHVAGLHQKSQVRHGVVVVQQHHFLAADAVTVAGVDKVIVLLAEPDVLHADAGFAEHE